MPHTIASILDSFRVLVQSLRVASRTSEQSMGLTGAQVFVLEKLRETDSLTVNELAERTHTHQSTVSVVVSKLVEKGLVSRERSKQDARVQILQITETGIAVLRDASATVQDRLVGAIGQFSKAEQAELGDLLQRVIQGAGLADVGPTLFLEDASEKA